MHVIDIIISIMWVAFWVFWLAAAAGAGVKPGRIAWGRSSGVRVAIFLIVLLLVHLRVFRGHSNTTSPWLQGIGFAIIVLGLGLAVWARFYIGRNWGMPMTEKQAPDLVKTGPYRTVRHPIYTGIIFAAVGTAIAVSLYWLVAVVVLGAYFIYSAVREERYLTTVFPDAYPEYKRSTKMLIPFIL